MISVKKLHFSVHHTQLDECGYYKCTRVKAVRPGSFHTFLFIRNSLKEHLAEPWARSGLLLGWSQRWPMSSFLSVRFRRNVHHRVLRLSSDSDSESKTGNVLPSRYGGDAMNEFNAEGVENAIWISLESRFEELGQPLGRWLSGLCVTAVFAASSQIDTLWRDLMWLMWFWHTSIYFLYPRCTLEILLVLPRNGFLWALKQHQPSESL